MKALEIEGRNEMEELNVYTDSQSVLRAISSIQNENEIVQHIGRLIRDRKLKCKFHLVRAHTGIIENEKVDMKAKEATEKENIGYMVKMSKRQISKILKDEALRKWQSR